MKAHAQVYQLTTPVSGYLTMSAQDLDSNAPAGSSASGSLNFTSLTETVYYDPVGETLRQAGVLSYGNSSGVTLQWQENQAGILGTVTVNLALVGGNLAFDTGLQSISYNGDADAYFASAPAFCQGMPVSGCYSLVTGGQTYTGSFSYILQADNGSSRGGCVTSAFNESELTDYPTSIYLFGLNYFGGINGPRYLASPGIVADVRADNGFELQLKPGIQWVDPIQGSNGEAFHWTSGGGTATTTTPAPTTIAVQPQSTTVNAYNTASFSGTAAGTGPFSYQWSFNGTNIPGAIYSVLNILNTTPTNLGTYSVLVTNQFGVATSSNAVLSMYPYITAPFTGAITYWGKSATFGIQAWGSGPLTYQWFDNGAAINGATNQSFILTTIQATNAGLYSVVVSNQFGNATNPPAQVLVEPAGVSVGLAPTVTIDGVVGYNYIIQRTVNLANTNSWVTVTNLTLTQSNQLWVDTNTDASIPSNSYRFYQVLPGP